MNNTMQEPQPGTPPPAGPQTDIAGWIGEGWAVFKKEPLVYILSTAIMGGVFLLLARVPFAGILVAGPMTIGFYFVASDVSRGISFNPGRLFEGFRHFLPAALASAVISLFTVMGLVLLILPGLMVYSWYLFAYLFIADRSLGFWEAMEASRKIAFRDITGFLLFYLVLIAVNVAGLLCLIFGLLVSVPVSILAVLAAYKKLAGFQTLGGASAGGA